MCVDMSRKAIKVKWTERMSSNLYSRVQEKSQGNGIFK